jgi:hypothetical protein
MDFQKKAKKGTINGDSVYCPRVELQTAYAFVDQQRKDWLP